jgi:putative SOS response-associated peptidase YedK
MTTAANDYIANIHDRMSVILEPKQFDQWLDPEVHDLQAIKSLLQPCSSNCLDSVEVSDLVNSPKNNHAEILAPVKP